MKFRYYLIGLVILFSACNKQSELIPKDTFVSLLIDLHMVDALSGDYGLKGEIAQLDSLTLEASVFKKHNTNKKALKNTLEWYSKQPKELAEVYDEVFGHLNKLNEEIKSQTDLFTGTRARSIWQLRKYKHVAGDTVKYPAPFIVKTEGVGTYLFDFKIRMLPQDRSEAPNLTVSFMKNKDGNDADDLLEVVHVPIMKSNYTRDYQYIYELNDSSYKFIKIVVPDTPDRLDTKPKNLQINKLRVLMKKEETQKNNPSSSAIAEPEKE